MKKIAQWISIVFFSTTGMSYGQTEASSQEQRTLLWEISGNGLSKPSYIAGTFHVLCREDFSLQPKVVQALKKTDQLVLEIDYTSPDELHAMQQMMDSGRKLSEQLSPEAAVRLDNVLKNWGLTLPAVESYTPAALYSLMASKAIPCPQAEVMMYEIELLKMAIKDKKKVGGLEKVTDQMQSISEAYDLQAIIEQLELSDQYEILSKKMISAFKNEDLVALDKLIKDPRFMNDSQEQAMLTNRNRNWVVKVPGIMQQSSTLFAVGSGHLWGKYGMIQLLTDLGYKLTPIHHLD